MERDLEGVTKDLEQNEDGQYLNLPDGAQNRKLSLMMQHQRKQMDGESIIDDNMTMISTSVIGVGAVTANQRFSNHDVMADLHGFLEKRKRDRNMQRNTMESQISGLVSNLRTDIDKMMLENERRKVL